MRRLMKILAGIFTSGGSAHAAAPAVRRTPLGVEGLEARDVPTTLNLHFPTTLPPGGTDPFSPQAQIAAKYQSLGGAGGLLGASTSGLLTAPTGNGEYETFQHGDIFYSPTTGAHDVYGATLTKYLMSANQTDAYGTKVQNILGLPTDDVIVVPGGIEQTFLGGAITQQLYNNPHTIYGGIYAEYLNAGGPYAFGLPTQDELPLTLAMRYQTFTGGGAIYWTQDYGAHAVYGAIGARYLQTAQETDAYGGNVFDDLGAPTGEEADVPGVPGARMQTFTGGAIYWSQATDAHAMFGAIYDYYANTLGGPLYDVIGLPTSEEYSVPYQGYRQVDLQNGAYLTWTEDTGPALSVPF